MRSKEALKALMDLGLGKEEIISGGKKFEATLNKDEAKAYQDFLTAQMRHSGAIILSIEII